MYKYATPRNYMYQTEQVRETVNFTNVSKSTYPYYIY